MKSLSKKTSPITPKGVYANYFEVGHTAYEIVIHCGERYGRTPSPCHTRIVTSPIYAQALLETLQRTLEQYKSTFGPVVEVEDHDSRSRGE
jgi:hypothetical protein